MPGFEKIAELIEIRFMEQWGAKTRVRYDNIHFVPPRSEHPWVGISIVQANATQATIEARPLVRYFGVIKLELSTALGEGTREARRLANDALAIFERKVFSGIHCGVGVFRDVGSDATGLWWKSSLTFDFYADNRR